MSRATARIKHDEIARMLKAARGAGLSIGGIEFDGQKLRIVINSGDSGETAPSALPSLRPGDALLEEPEL